MYLSDRDLRHALALGQLIVNPAPTEIDTTAIDLHLDGIETAKIWDVEKYEERERASGHEPQVLCIGKYNVKVFGREFAVPLPTSRPHNRTTPYLDGNQVIVPPHGFFLWQTAEEVGTPEIDPRLICFIDGKSTRARAGLLVHMTAPTIHAGWWGKVTLELCNLGPFTLSLRAGDAVAQIVVAAISSPPQKKKSVAGIDIGQTSVTGSGS